MTSTGDRWARADELLESALDLEGADREAFLDRECGNDGELRALVARLLSHADAEDSFMTPGGAVEGSLLDTVTHAGSRAADADASGAVIDRYRLIEEVGRGGMAVVYRAERADGEFEQQVALKLIRRGVDTADVIRRFERERQILARIRHPHISTLLDGGTSEDGRPFLVMELVDGRPIDEYCDAHNLTVTQRLRLFLQAADAVAHAHRMLVVHRDIKPSNILVDAAGTVKLLDFGIARLLGPDTEGERLTRTRQRLLTPAFASPEQIRGEPVTTSSDVYQLGVLLYLMLTGRLPYGDLSPGSHEFARAIVETEPDRPSVLAAKIRRTSAGDPRTTTLEQLSRRRGISPAAWRRALSGDLDTILLTALRKEPERRYGSVAELSEDLRRHLGGRPVAARPDTFGYRASKFVRRNRLTVGVATVAFAGLLAFAAAISVQAGRLARERDRANTEAATAERVSEFLVDLFKVTDPGRAMGETVTAREILDKGAATVEADLADQPIVQARLMNTIGRVYQNLGLYDDAAPLVERALEIRRAALGDDHEDVAKSLHSLGWLTEERGDSVAAERMYREALAIERARHGDVHERVAVGLNNLGLVLFKQDKRADAETSFREAIDMRRTLGDLRSTQMADALSNLGLVLHRTERLDEAEAAYAESLDIRREVLGDDHPHVAISLDNIGRLHYAREEYDAALDLFERSLEVRRRVLGNDHPATAQSINNIASIRTQQKDYATAIPMFREVVAIDRRKLGDDHPNLGISLGNLAIVTQRADRFAEAEGYFREALAIFESAFEPGHHLRTRAHGNLGGCLVAMERYAEAEPHLLEAHAGLVAVEGPDHRRTRKAAEGLADLYDAWGKPGKAAEYRTESPRAPDP